MLVIAHNNIMSRWMCNGCTGARWTYISTEVRKKELSFCDSNNIRNIVTEVQRQRKPKILSSSNGVNRWNSSSSSSTKPLPPPLEAASNPKMAATTTTKLTVEEEARAEKMFAELKDLMIKRQRRIEAEQSKSWYDSIQAFWNSSKNQLINIAAAFACVLMAVQVTDAKISARKSAAYAKGTEDDMAELKYTLRYICSEHFAKDVATNYYETATSLQRNNDATKDVSSNGKKSSSWLFSLLNNNLSSKNDPQHDMIVNTHTLASVIGQHIRAVLGEKHPLTDAERVEIEVQQLQKFMGSGNELNPSAQELVTSVGEIEESLDAEDGSKIIKKRKIMF